MEVVVKFKAINHFRFDAQMYELQNNFVYRITISFTMDTGCVHGFHTLALPLISLVQGDYILYAGTWLYLVWWINSNAWSFKRYYNYKICFIGIISSMSIQLYHSSDIQLPISMICRLILYWG